MTRVQADTWCERGIVALVLGILVFGPLALGGVRTGEFLVLQALTVLVMVLWLLRFWLNPRLHLLWPPACWGALAFAAYAVGRYWFADLEYVARLEMLRVILYAVIFLVCVNNLYHQGSIRLVVYVLVFVGTVEGCWAVYQYFTHAPRIWGALRPGSYLDRASGTYICPNHLVGFLEMILPLGVAFTAAARARPLSKVFVGYGCVAMAAGIAFSISRAGWVAAAFGLLLLLCLLAHTLRQWIALALFVVMLLVGGLWTYSRSPALQKRFSSLHQLVTEPVTTTNAPASQAPPSTVQMPGTNSVTITNDLGSQERRLSLRKALYYLKRDTRYGQSVAAYKMWRDHPWIGVGPAHFDVRYRGYRAASGLLQSRPGWVHNDYLNTLADWGAIGTLLVAFPLVMVAGGLARHWGRLRRTRLDAAQGGGGVLPFVAGAAAGLGALLLHSVADFNMHIPANAILAVVLLALLASHLRFATDRWWITTNWPIRLVATCLLLGAAVFFVWQGVRSAKEDFWLRRARALPVMSAERIAALQNAVAVEPNNTETILLVAEQYRWQSWQGGENYQAQARQAMEWFERAARLDPYDPLSRLGIGACLDWLERPDEAKPWYDKALELDPNGCHARAMMGWHYYQIGDYQNAHDWCLKSLNIDWNRSPLALYYFRAAYFKLEEQKRARPPNK